MECFRISLICGYIWFFLLSCSNVHGSTESYKSSTKPNVIFFLIDDWGYNDVGYYGNTDTQTPFINKLVEEESVRIDKYYVMPECTATRCALLTGRYPMRYGLQDGILYYQSPYALSGKEHLLSSEFQAQGYETHLVGKWHLGMMAEQYTPTLRGFDTFVGFYAGLIYYYSHYGIEDSYPDKIDFHNGLEGWHEEGRYTMYTYQDRILNIIDESAEKEDPFFLYVGWQGSHYPSQAPDDYVNMYKTDSDSDSDIDDDSTSDDDSSDSSDSSTTTKDNRRIYFQAQTTLTDDLLAEMVTHLKETGVWENTLLVVCSDNGADWGFGDNSPLRGSKFTLWEGGVRVPAFITGGYLPENRKGTILNDIPIHVTDWYPTLLAAAGINKQSPNQLDGKNLWKFLKNADEFRTDEVLSDRVILLNADEYGCGTDVCGAVLYGGRWKLVTGTNQLVSWETGSPELDTCFWHRDYSLSEENDVFACGEVPEGLVTDSCICSQGLCLFDLENDPCEYYNVYDDNLDIAHMLTKVLEDYYSQQTLVLFDSIFNVATVIAAKGTHEGYWEPWADDTEGFTTWDELKFEQILLPYFNAEKERNGMSSDETNKSDAQDKSMNALWIGLTVAALGVFIFVIFLIWRFCFVSRMEATKIKKRDELKREQQQRQDEEEEDGKHKTAGARIDAGVNVNTVSVHNFNQEERLPLKTNEIGSGNSYLTTDSNLLQ